MSASSKIFGFILLVLGVVIAVLTLRGNPWLSSILTVSWAGYLVAAVIIIIGLILLFSRSRRTIR